MPDCRTRIWSSGSSRNGEAGSTTAESLAARVAARPRALPASRPTVSTEFEAEVVAAGARLPETFRRHLDAVALTVEEMPSQELLFEADPPFDPELLGLFVGVRSPTGSLHLHRRDALSDLLFQRNLERHALDAKSCGTRSRSPSITSWGITSGSKKTTWRSWTWTSCRRPRPKTTSPIPLATSQRGSPSQSSPPSNSSFFQIGTCSLERLDCVAAGVERLRPVRRRGRDEHRISPIRSVPVRWTGPSR